MVQVSYIPKAKPAIPCPFEMTDAELAEFERFMESAEVRAEYEEWLGSLPSEQREELDFDAVRDALEYADLVNKDDGDWYDDSWIGYHLTPEGAELAERMRG